jgi:hypothetical protein
VNKKRGSISRVIRNSFTPVFLSLALLVNNAVPAFAVEKSAEFKAALAQMSIKNDQVKNIKWYQDKSSPKYVNRNGFYLYVGASPNFSTTLRLKIQYYGDDWLFIEKYIFNVDGDVYEINPDYGDVETDNDSKVWEWLDISPNSSQVSMLKAISKSKKTIMRLEGSKYYKDVVITSAQKSAIKRVLVVYAGLGGR